MGDCVVNRAITQMLLCASGLMLLPNCSRTSEAKSITTPSGQVWLTSTQMKNAKLEMGSVAARNLRNTLVTTGKVSFDDLHVSHVFHRLPAKSPEFPRKLGNMSKRVTLWRTLTRRTWVWLRPN